MVRLLPVTNMRDGRLLELLAAFQRKDRVACAQDGERSHWSVTKTWRRVLAEPRRVDAVIQVHGLGL